MRSITATLAMVLALAPSAAAVEVELTVRESAGVERSPALVTAGIPFARGTVTDVGRLAVTRDGKPVPAQFLKTVPWDDGSVRWALMDVQVPVTANGQIKLVLSDSGNNHAPAHPVKIEDKPEAMTLNTGPMVVVLPRKQPGLFQSIRADGSELVTGVGKGLVLVTEDGAEHRPGPPTEMTVEQAGPMRALVRVRGTFSGVHNDLLTYTARVTVYAGARRVKLQVWLENQGAMGYFYTPRKVHWTDAKSPNLEWFPFKGMRLDLGLGLGEQPTIRCEQVESKGSLRVEQQWHKVAPGLKRGRRGPYYTEEDWQYAITADEKDTHTGLRTDGVVRVAGESAALTAAIRNFWQEYPKALETDGRTLSFCLWPIGGRWPVQPFRHKWYPDFVRVSERNMYWLQGGVHKGHEMVLDFSGADARESHAELTKPLFAFAPAAYYAASEAAPGMFAAPDVRTTDRMCNLKLASWNRMARNAVDPASPSSVHVAMKGVHGLGWMDYGDLCVFARGHVALHYDWTYIALLNAMRFGEMNFLRLGTDMARHRIDVDQLWSDRDMKHVNALQRCGSSVVQFHVGHLPRQHPSVAQNWIAGVVLYYMLTGEPKALECALRNGTGIRRAWETKPRVSVEGLAWSIANYLALYKVTGEKTWLEDARALFKEKVVPIWKNEGSFLHDPGRLFWGQSYHKTDIAYCYSVAVWCELHHLTGDEDVMKMLSEACAKEWPSKSYYNAPLFLSDLRAYVGLKTENPEVLTEGARMFGRAFPLSKCPPTYVKGVNGWSVEKAMMLRAGHILQYAASKQK